MKIAILYAESRFTPWLENIDTPTAIHIHKSLPKYCFGTIVHMTSPSKELAELLASFDFVINLCYGFMNQNQAEIAEWLDSNRIKHLSSGGFQQQLAQDKLQVELMLIEHEINVPKSVNVATEIVDGLYISKPRKGGCHRDIEIVSNAIATEKFDHWVSEDKLTQPYLMGREFSIAIIPNETGSEFIALPPLEVIPYPARNVYMAGQSHGKTRKTYYPNLTTEEYDSLVKATIDSHVALGLTFFSRVDVRLVDGTPFILDVNTMPNMHITKSMLPGLLKAHKISLTNFIERLIRMGERIYGNEVSYKENIESEVIMGKNYKDLTI